MYSLIRLVKKSRKYVSFKTKTPDLKKCPQKRAICIKIAIITPRKPNSAKRKTVKITITSTGRKTSAYIPGIGHDLQRFKTVLIRGGGAKDLPGIRYSCIRGKYDFSSVQFRTSRRSIYGIGRLKR